jgi:hypothetical protein
MYNDNIYTDANLMHSKQINVRIKKCVNESDSSNCKSDNEIMAWLLPKQFEIYLRYEKIDFLQRNLKPTYKSDETLTRYSPNTQFFE